jgi:hypothetical protein
VLGTREFRKYYRQRHKPVDGRQSVAVNSVLARWAAPRSRSRCAALRGTRVAAWPPPRCSCSPAPSLDRPVSFRQHQPASTPPPRTAPSHHHHHPLACRYRSLGIDTVDLSVERAQRRVAEKRDARSNKSRINLLMKSNVIRNLPNNVPY